MDDRIKLTDCIHINEYIAGFLQKMFLIYKGREVDHIELGCPPEMWVKIVFEEDEDE